MSESTVHVSREIMNRFMGHVEQKSGKDGCWLWKGSLHKTHGNSPMFSYTENETSKNQTARAFIHQRTTGNIPKPGDVKMVYRTTCKNPLCVKPSHIKVISMKDLMEESRNKKAAKSEIKTAPVVIKPEAVVKAKQMIQEYKNKNPLQFLAEPIKGAIERQKQKIVITQDLVSELQKELALFEEELKRVEG